MRKNSVPSGCVLLRPVGYIMSTMEPNPFCFDFRWAFDFIKYFYVLKLLKLIEYETDPYILLLSHHLTWGSFFTFNFGKFGTWSVSWFLEQVTNSYCNLTKKICFVPHSWLQHFMFMFSVMWWMVWCSNFELACYFFQVTLQTFNYLGS